MYMFLLHQQSQSVLADSEGRVLANSHPCWQVDVAVV